MTGLCSSVVAGLLRGGDEGRQWEMQVIGLYVMRTSALIGLYVMRTSALIGLYVMRTSALNHDHVLRTLYDAHTFISEVRISG